MDRDIAGRRARQENVLVPVEALRRLDVRDLSPLSALGSEGGVGWRWGYKYHARRTVPDPEIEGGVFGAVEGGAWTGVS